MRLPRVVFASVCLFVVSTAEADWTENLVPGPMNVVTGVVTYVHSWIKCTGVVASPDDPNGRGVYASGAVPGEPAGKFVGCDRLDVGDLVIIHSRCSKFLLEPGLTVTSFERVGSVKLPNPLEFRFADLASGSCNNRRVRVRGVVRSVTQANVNGRDLYLITLGMADGVLVVRTSIERDWQALVDAEISVDGVVFALINNRFEFLAPELETIGTNSVRVLSLPPVNIPEVRIDGSMSRARKTYDRHRCRVIGEVTERSTDGRDFTIQCAGTALAVHCNDEAPLVGMKVEAVGFPQMEQDVAGICCANWSEVPESDVKAVAMDISLDNFAEYMVGVVDLAKVDLCNRLVRIHAKLLSEPIVDNGCLRLDLVADGYQFFATLPLDRSGGIADRLRDLPSVRVTGVLHFEFARSAKDARYRSLGSVELRMRDHEDIDIISDFDYRWRRCERTMRTVGLWALIPLCLFPLLMIHLRYHRHLRTRALLADRRRIAHDLHDSISQHMAGVKLLLDTVRSNPGALSEEQLAALSVADGVLGEARREMREAILDLQNDDLLLRPLESLIRRFAMELNASGKVRVRMKLRGLPAVMAPGMKRDLLAVIREASANAIRHGEAKNIAVVSDPVGAGEFSLGVYNDGVPFDVDAAPGPEEGHFGLTGIRERALRCGFEVRFVDTGTLRGLVLEKEDRT